MRNGRSQSGFTLVELLISLAVMGFSISLAMGIFVAQQNSFQSLDLLRVAQEAGRDASLDFETSLRRAGFGMDPQYALDFKTYNCTVVQGTLCRDRTTGPDEIVFYARNPYYRWDSTNGFTSGNGWAVGSGSSGTTLNLVTRTGDTFQQGQILALTATDGSSPVSGSSSPSSPLMVTVAKQVVATGTTTPITVSTQNGDPYQNPISGSPQYAFMIDRFRYYIATQPDGTPYLMFDSGLKLDGTNVEQVPVAKNVEDLQIAYVLNTRTAGGAGPDVSNTNWIVGDAPGTQEQPDPSVTPVPDYVSTPPTDTSRFTVHPANVRMVRYSFVIRSYRPDPYQPASWAGDLFPFEENRDTTTSVPALGRYRRVVITGSVALRNMESRSAFVF